MVIHHRTAACCWTLFPAFANRVTGMLLSLDFFSRRFNLSYSLRVFRASVSHCLCGRLNPDTSMGFTMRLAFSPFSGRCMLHCCSDGQYVLTQKAHVQCFRSTVFNREWTPACHGKRLRSSPTCTLLVQSSATSVRSGVHINMIETPTHCHLRSGCPWVNSVRCS